MMKNKMEFDYYYGAEAEQFTFIRVPRILFSDKEHFETLSNDAKILYGLKRSFLSIGNNLNQIAAVANASGSVYQKDIEDLQAEYKYFRDMFKKYLAEISPTFFK